ELAVRKHDYARPEPGKRGSNFAIQQRAFCNAVGELTRRVTGISHPAKAAARRTFCRVGILHGILAKLEAEVSLGIRIRLNVWPTVAHPLDGHPLIWRSALRELNFAREKHRTP